MSRRFTKAQISRFCPEGQRELRGKVISTEWNRCKKGTWLLWWLHDSLWVLSETHTIRRDIYNALGFHLSFSQEGDRAQELALARYVRARYYSTGRRK